MVVKTAVPVNPRLPDRCYDMEEAPVKIGAMNHPARNSKHDRLAAAHQEAEGDRLRRYDHASGLRIPPRVSAAESGLAASVVETGVGRRPCRERRRTSMRAGS